MREETGNAISVSLMNRKVYAVISTESEPISAFHGALYLARRRYFETGRAAKVNEDGLFEGMPGTLVGKVKKRGFSWEKKVGDRVLEASFKEGAQRGVAFFAPNGVLLSKVFFDRDLRWLRTEYFSPDDGEKASCSFKPDPVRDAVLRFDYDRDTGSVKETPLFPVPYAFQTVEQSLQNADLGDRFLLVADDTGEYLYCPKPEQEQRLRFLQSAEGASLFYTMAWEIKDGETAGAPAPLPVPRFTDLETPAEPEPPEADSEPETETAPTEPSPKPEAGNEKALSALGITAEEAEHARSVLEKLFSGEVPEGSGPFTLIRGGAESRYTGQMENGKREGMGRTESPEGLTMYQGEYKNDLRDGFGVHHYPSGAVSYVGSFRKDRRDGFGVSFREGDHALHVSRWENGAPKDFVSLYSPDGALQYAGRIVDGKKEGVGVSVRDPDGAVFVAKYKDGEMTGEGALFSPDGALLYVGGWKDGKRCGRGTSFDAAGDVVYTGEWKDDRYTNGILYKRVQDEAEKA